MFHMVAGLEAWKEMTGIMSGWNIIAYQSQTYLFSPLLQLQGSHHFLVIKVELRIIDMGRISWVRPSLRKLLILICIVSGCPHNGEAFQLYSADIKLCLEKWFNAGREIGRPNIHITVHLDNEYSVLFPYFQLI